MSRTRQSLVYVGIKHHVIAFDRKSGTMVWKTELPAKYRSTGMFVNVMRDREGLFATCAGEIFSLDPRTGALLWHDPLKKLGTGVMSMATDLGGESSSAVSAAIAAQMAAAASTTTTTNAAI